MNESRRDNDRQNCKTSIHFHHYNHTNTYKVKPALKTPLHKGHLLLLKAGKILT